MTNRKSVSKKTRFEVFKRDSFRCQYCGRSAPDVVLEIDHIKPVSEGGTNDITNLITSCFDCNRGKGDRLLDDNTILEKQRKQLEELNERRLQLEMMMKWREELMSLEKEKVGMLKSTWSELTDYTPNENGERVLRRLIKKYDFNSIIDSMEAAANQYLKYDAEKNEYTQESVEKAFDYIERICANKERLKEKPYLKDLYYIRGILRNRLAYCNEWQALTMLEDAYLAGASIESLKDFALTVKNWTNFKHGINEFLAGAENDR